MLRHHGETLHRTFEINNDAVPSFSIRPHCRVVDVDAVELRIPSSRVPQNVTGGVVEGDEGSRAIVCGDRVYHTVDVANVAKNHLAVALLAVSSGHDVVAVSQPCHIRPARTLMACPRGYGMHSTGIPDRIFAVLETCAQKGTCKVPLHLLQLSANKVDRDNFLLRKHIPDSASTIADG